MGAFAFFLGLLLAVPLFLAFAGMFISGIIIILAALIIFLIIHKYNQKRMKQNKKTVKKLKLIPVFMIIIGILLCCPMASVVVNVEKDMNAEKELKGELYIAADYQQYDKVKKLLDGGYEPDYSANYSRTPLSAACRNQDNKMVKLLLDYGADPNNPSGDYTPLLMAARYDGDFNVELIEMLINAGANPAYCYNGETMPYSYYLGYEEDENLLQEEDQNRFKKIKELLKPAYEKYF